MALKLSPNCELCVVVGGGVSFYFFIFYFYLPSSCQGRGGE